MDVGLEKLFKAAMRLMYERNPRKYTRLQVLRWMVQRFQRSPRTASK